MKSTYLIPILILFPMLCIGQSDLKNIILNKEQTIPSDWVTTIQKQGEWKFVEIAAIRGKKVKDSYSSLTQDGKSWIFGENELDVLPHNSKIEGKKYAHCPIKYHELNRTMVITPNVRYGDLTAKKNEIYRVINLTSEYLILEQNENVYCFDYSEGRELSRKECKEKSEKEQSTFGGKTINIGKKLPTLRLVFTCKPKN